MIQEDSFWTVFLHRVYPSFFVSLADRIELIGHLLEDKIESTLVVYIVLVFSEIFFGEFFENVVER